MRKNRTIAVIVGNDDRDRQEAEDLQYWLLGQDFHWANRLNIKNYTASFTLFIDLESKSINWSATSTLTTAEGNAYKVFNLSNEYLSLVFAFIRNPVFPVEYTEVQSINGDKARVFADGKVEFWDVSEDKLQCTTDEATIFGIARQLNKGKGLPVVEFYYPSSTSGTNMRRFVKVVRFDDDALLGFQVEKPTDGDGDFKKFLKEKISGTVKFLWFVQ